MTVMAVPDFGTAFFYDVFVRDFQEMTMMTVMTVLFLYLYRFIISIDVYMYI
jgi:hypothetical protein